MQDQSVPSYEKLRQIIKDTVIQYSEKPFTLASGKKSHQYFDMRILSGNPEGLHEAATILHDMVKNTGARSVGGLAAGAIPIATMVSSISFCRGDTPPLNMFFVRKTTKDHGTGQQIEGVTQTPVAILDDVITSGGSALQAARVAQKNGLEVVGIFCILFRGSEQNRRELERISPLRHVFTQDDFVQN